MLSKNQIKQITSLKVKKFREENRQFIAEGHKLVTELINSRFTIIAVYASADWIVTNLSVIRSKNIPAVETELHEMERISALATPSPVLAVIAMPDPVFAISPFRHFAISLSLALDDIRDPGNLGTIIRIADWFGIETVLCSENCVDIYNPKVVQATMGSIARVSVVRCNLAEVLKSYASDRANVESCIPVYGTFLDGGSIYDSPLSETGIIVIGNESTGISPGLQPFITHKLSIPAYGTSDLGKAESLNASIATAVICAEFRRRHRNE
jgi:TrmH family RNA methyltransferase